MITKRQQVLDFMKHQSFVRPRDLVARGLPKDYLHQLASEGLVERVGRGLYCLPVSDVSEWSSYIEVQQRIPKATFCLLSALAFHNIGTENPHELWVSIANKAWRPKIEYPPVRFISMSGDALTSAIEIHHLGGIEVQVYSPAKTVADCFKFRNKLGIDVAIHALKEGWQDSKFTVDELMHCAKICRVHNIIQPYVESIAAN